jgi:hypothetical protein
MNGSYKIFRVTLEINTDDAATPAIVSYKDRTATYDCAMDEGEIDGIAMTQREIDGLEKWRDKVDKAYATARAGHPDYS